MEENVIKIEIYSRTAKDKNGNELDYYLHTAFLPNGEKINCKFKKGARFQQPQTPDGVDIMHFNIYCQNDFDCISINDDYRGFPVLWVTKIERIEPIEKQTQKQNRKVI